MRQLRIGMSQLNTTVGDFASNTKKILEAINEARSLGVDLITFPELARYRNSLDGSETIPSTIIDKLPSAELRPDQRDTGTLPAYDQLDSILTAYVEEDKSVEQIIAMGFNQEVVKRTAQLVDGSEYKRRQAPPGIKITPRAFGRDRRLPITNQFKG